MIRCMHCGRGITYRRAGRDSAVAVVRTDFSSCVVKENGDKHRPTTELDYCGVCFLEDRHVHEPGDVYYLQVGDSPETWRWILLAMEVAA